MWKEKVRKIRFRCRVCVSFVRAACSLSTRCGREEKEESCKRSTVSESKPAVLEARVCVCKSGDQAFADSLLSFTRRSGRWVLGGRRNKHTHAMKQHIHSEGTAEEETKAQSVSLLRLSSRVSLQVLSSSPSLPLLDIFSLFIVSAGICLPLDSHDEPGIRGVKDVSRCFLSSLPAGDPRSFHHMDSLAAWTA